MLFKQNKTLILSALAVLVVWLGIQFLVIQDNWAAAAMKLDDAAREQEVWEKNFKTGDKLLPKPAAEAALVENKKQLAANLSTLQKIEFGTKETLQPYSEAAAGTGDRKNYLATKRTTLLNRAKDSQGITAPAELGMGDKISEDPVAVNLLRVAVLDSFINACHKAGVPRIAKIQHMAPRFVKRSEPDPSADENADAEASTGDRLVQFHMKVQVYAAERAFGRLLYELQKPSEATRGYLCLRGFHVSVRDSGSGLLEGTVAVSALLNEKLVNDLKIPMKSEDDARRGAAPNKEIDINRY